jgi:hypothetical protein
MLVQWEFRMQQVSIVSLRSTFPHMHIGHSESDSDRDIEGKHVLPVIRTFEP